MTNWNFSIRWIDEQHILLSFTQEDRKHELLFPVHNYAEFMELAQTFNSNFRDKIDQQILNHYTNNV